MKADTLRPQALFQKQVRYEIPPFQRPYVWNQETQWEPLWEDVRDAAESSLASGTAADPHFMGAVVLQQCSTTTREVERRIVVDGQQRFTTIQLLLDAVQEELERRGHERCAKRLSLLVLNDPVFFGDDPDQAFKLWPTTSDRDAFRHAMHNELPSAKHASSLVVQAHEFFKEQVGLWLDDCPDPTGAPEALEHAVSELLELVVIDIETTDDPNVIFETLNARGTPLLQSDLIKNYIMYKAGVRVHDTSEAPADLWRLDDKWWRREVRQGRLSRPQVDVFLNYWLVTRKREQVPADSVFRVFQQYSESLEASNSESLASMDLVAADIRDVARVYRDWEEGRYPDFELFRYRQEVIQVGVLTPVLLWLLSSSVPGHQVGRSLGALESYLVRRMVCRMTSKDYNNLFIGLLQRLEERGACNAGDAVVAYLAEQEAHARQWPDDRVFMEHFVRAPLYRLLSRARLRLVLEAIEQELHTNKAESASVPRGLTIEHIMPQQWRQHWPLRDDVEDKTAAGFDRDRIVHSIGNLTLVNHRLNASLSNAPWEEKQGTLRKHTTLFLNKDFLAEPPPDWDEATVYARADRLFESAIRVWPPPTGFP